MRDAAGELADRFHAGALVDLVLQRALAGGLKHVDDCGLGVALRLLDGRHVEPAPALDIAGKRSVERRDLTLALGRQPDPSGQRVAVGLRHRRRDRAGLARLFHASPEQPP